MNEQQPVEISNSKNIHNGQKGYVCASGGEDKSWVMIHVSRGSKPQMVTGAILFKNSELKAI